MINMNKEFIEENLGNMLKFLKIFKFFIYFVVAMNIWGYYQNNFSFFLLSSNLIICLYSIGTTRIVQNLGKKILNLKNAFNSLG